MTDAEVRALVTDAFKSVPRPDHFTDHTHCDECQEHDEVLRGRDLDSLVISDVGSQAWNPITMATPQGFAYYLPALDRLALEPMPQGWDWYGYIILFELRWNGPHNERWLYCTPRQRKVVIRVLEHIYTTRRQDIHTYDCEYELLEALEIWSDAGE